MKKNKLVKILALCAILAMSLPSGQTGVSPYGKMFLSLISMQSRQKPDTK